MTHTEVIADYCNSEIDLTGPCSCVDACGYKEQMLANPYCGICDGTGVVTIEALTSKVDQLSEAIDQLNSEAADVCVPAKKFLELAWWHAENAYRQLTGHCSLQTSKDRDGSVRVNQSHGPGRYCACCAQYDRLKSVAERLGRSL